MIVSIIIILFSQLPDAVVTIAIVYMSTGQICVYLTSAPPPLRHNIWDI